MPASTRITTTYDTNTGVARLKISDAILNDAGQYTVVAENKAGSDHTDGRLEVEKESIIDNKPIIDPNAFMYLNKPEGAQKPRREQGEPLIPARVIVPLQNIHTNEGKPCRMVCKIEGNPPPSVVWFKNGIVLPASNRYNPHFDLKTGVASLKVNEAQANDSGLYEVAVENIAGSDRTAANLIVDHVPDIDQSPIIDPNAFKYLNAAPQSPKPRAPDADEVSSIRPPKVIIPLKDIKVNEDQPATFMSKIIGYPIPKVR